MANPTPQQYQQAEQTLSSLLGHSATTRGEAYQTLRAVEVTSVKDQNDKRIKITDENQIFYRTAIQNKRDASELDLREFITESMDEILSTDKQKNLEFNWKMFQDYVFQTISLHLELQFGDLWNKLDYKVKKTVSDETALLILALIRKDKNILEQLTQGMRKEDSEYIDSLFATNFKLVGSGPTLLSISTPIITEMIFRNKVLNQAIGNG